MRSEPRDSLDLQEEDDDEEVASDSDESRQGHDAQSNVNSHSSVGGVQFPFVM